MREVSFKKEKISYMLGVGICAFLGRFYHSGGQLAPLGMSRGPVVPKKTINAVAIRGLQGWPLVCVPSIREWVSGLQNAWGNSVAGGPLCPLVA